MFVVKRPDQMHDALGPRNPIVWREDFSLTLTATKEESYLQARRAIDDGLPFAADSRFTEKFWRRYVGKDLFEELGGAQHGFRGYEGVVICVGCHGEISTTVCDALMSKTLDSEVLDFRTLPS
jgi:hypothetical protein